MDRFIPDSELDPDTTYVMSAISEENLTKKPKKTRIKKVKAVITDPWSLGLNNLPVSNFLTHTGLKVPVPTNELGFFRLFITEYIVSYMVQESNRYAQQILGEEEYNNFTMISIEDMNKFMCLLIYIGICDLPSYEMFWKKKDNPFYNDFCSNIMSYERFNTLKRFFHVFDNDVFNELETNQIKISKLDGLIAYFNKKFYDVYDPERELAVDENMCSWSGGGGSKVYMPLKPVKYGIKLYSLCESKTGYACSIIQYNAKKPESNIDMLTRLTQNYKNKGHHLYMDNFYTSQKVFENLLEDKIYCCGTLRDGRGGPKDLKRSLKNYKKGEGICYKSEKTNCIGFMDNGPVVILTNIHSNVSVSVDTAELKIANLNTSNIVKDYNNYMGGVDLMDQMTKYYAISRKSRKWTSKLCFHILNIAFYNSYVMYKKFGTNINKKSYLKYLTTMIYKLSNPNQPLVSSNEPHEVINTENSVLFSQITMSTPTPITHFPIKITKRRRCYSCKSVGTRKDVNTACSGCGIPLCVFECFPKWHNNQ